MFFPGEDLPHRLTTDYLVSEGEEITVDGRAWLVEGVDLIEAAEDGEDPVDRRAGTVTVVAPNDPSTP